MESAGPPAEDIDVEEDVVNSNPRFREDDLEDVESVQSGNVEEDVLVAVPTKRHEQQLDKFYAKIGALSNNKDVPCENCRATQGVVDFLAVSAPFGDLSERFIYVRFCKACSRYSVLRKQEIALDVVSEDIKEEPKQTPLFGEFDPSATPSDDQLEALFAAASISKSESKTKSSASSKSSKKLASGKTRLFEFVNEYVDDEEEDLSHEKALLEKYNKEARELGEDTFDIIATKSKSPTPVVYDAESFIARIQLEPHQRVRYYYKGNALVPSNEANRDTKIQRVCDSCGAPRTLEFQVMPQAITDIESLLGLELDFSTILVFTCSKSCDSGSREECIVVPSI